jgi:hypothetical protein
MNTNHEEDTIMNIDESILGSHMGHFTYNFIVAFYCIALWPLVIKLVSHRKEA